MPESYRSELARAPALRAKLYVHPSWRPPQEATVHGESS